MDTLILVICGMIAIRLIWAMLTSHPTREFTDPTLVKFDQFGAHDEFGSLPGRKATSPKRSGPKHG